MNILEWLILPAALLGGLVLFALFAMIISGTSYEFGKRERLAKLESDHHMRSQAETNELVVCLYAGDLERYEEKKARYQRAWNQRVKEIVEIECPIDDETMAELEAGINPYR